MIEESNNIGCENIHDCGGCRYYYACANDKYYINDTQITKENIKEMKKKYKFSNKQTRLVRGGSN